MKARQPSTISVIQQQLELKLPKELVADLLDSFVNLRKYYFLHDYISSGIRAGRFSETGLRVVQFAAFNNYTPLNIQLSSFPAEVTRLANVPVGAVNESIRLLIPKTLQVVYDLRNKRNIGHTGGDVDSNFEDATVALSCCSWIVAELIRIYYTGNIGEAQRLVDSIVQTKVPLIQEFEGHLKILKKGLPVSQKILVLLSYRKDDGMKIGDLTESIGKKHAQNIRTTLCNLDTDGYVYKRESKKQANYLITLAGEKFVVDQISFEI